MVALVDTVAFLGIESRRVNIQVHIADGGLPSFNIVGLADKAIGESRERVRAAFSSIGLGIPARRITVNLAPADLLKEGSHFDLGIAIGLLVAMQIIPQEEILNFIAIGELSLDGSITRINGTLPAAILAKQLGFGIVCPADNGAEAACSSNQRVVAAENLLEIVNHFTGKQYLPAPEAIMLNHHNDPGKHNDMRDIVGQENAKYALEIAAAGNHNMLMIGPPGSGKSMLAKRLPTILPDLTAEEMLEVSVINSIAGQPDALFNSRRPFRSPHCSASMPAMVGGGSKAKPGEITLAHHGVLFLDELPEFKRDTLEALRQPIESGFITVARAENHIHYPAKCLLVAAMNPCKCGYFGSASQPSCRMAPKCAADYQSRISGPLFDRFDLQVEVGAVDHILFTDDILTQSRIRGESSAVIAARIKQARDIQRARYRSMQLDITSNSNLDGEALHKTITLDETCKDMLRKAIDKFQLSMRGINRVLRVARTVADLNGRESSGIEPSELATALNYRLVKRT